MTIMAKTKAKAGDRVKVLIRAGLCQPREGGDIEPRFSSVCEPGTEGVYLGPHLTLSKWHQVQVGGQIAPLHASQFEVIQ